MPRLPTPLDFLNSSLTYSIIPPPVSPTSPNTPVPPVNILILLHGLGDTEAPFTAMARNMQLRETAAISIRGLFPVPDILIEKPGYHWGNEILVDQATGALASDGGFDRAIQVLERWVVRVLVENCGFPERNIMWLGLGQGAMVALGLAALLPTDKEFGGVISIGGRLPANIKKGEGKGRTPILVCGGSRSTEITRSAVDGLKAAFREVEYIKWSKAEDSMPNNREEMLPLMRLFGRRLQSRAGVPEGASEI